jgi:predicted HTH transcriptional regulator
MSDYDMIISAAGDRPNDCMSLAELIDAVALLHRDASDDGAAVIATVTTDRLIITTPTPIPTGKDF